MGKVRIYNKTLCPRLWKDMKLDPQVRINLLQTAKDFYEKTQFKAPIKDIYFMGSAASYNWTPESDIDVHVLVDFNQLQMPEDTAMKAIKTAAVAWNNEHKIMVKGHEVEMNLQNATEEKPHVNGIYSLVHDKWIRPPQKETPKVDKMAIVSKYNKVKNYLRRAIQTGDREYMKSVKEYLDAMRQYGLDTHGELSVENIVFKILRARGYIKQLKDTIVQKYDQKMSVKERDVEEGILGRFRKGSNIPGKDVQRIKSKYFVAFFGKFQDLKPGVGAVYLRKDPDTRFAQIFVLPQDWGKLGGRWVINRAKGAHDLALPEIPGGFESAEATLKTLDNWYRKRKRVKEGYGAGIPETDRLHIPGKRWQIRSKDAPKTPDMEKEEVIAVNEEAKKETDEGFDPTSVGPNPDASEGSGDSAFFYKDQINKMRKMGAPSLKELLNSVGKDE